MKTPTDQFVQAMLNPAIYPGSCCDVRMIETNISWIFLAGPRAWKIKKPVDLGFADFTTVTQRLIDSGPTIRLRSDVERKRIFGLAAEATSEGRLRQQMYSPDASVATYRTLAEQATTVIKADYPVVIDAAFLCRADRRRFARLAARLQVSFTILRCTALETQLHDRLRARQRRGRDASEADGRVLERQLREYDELSPEEGRFVMEAEDV